MTRPPPCQAVTVSQAASWAAVAGVTRAVTRAWPGEVLASASVARCPEGCWVTSPLATSPAMATAAAMSTPRATGGRGSSPRSPRPSSAPTAPPAVPAMAAQISPSGMSDAFHGSGMTRCVHGHSAANPTVPHNRPDPTKPLIDPVIQKFLGPLAMLPAPVKYRVYFGEPLRFEGDANDDEAVIAAKVAEVKSTIQRMIDHGLQTRKGILV